MRFVNAICYIIFTFYDQGVSLRLPLSDLLDVTKEIMRIEKQISKVSLELDPLIKRLESPAFADKAKPDVVNSVRSSVAEKQAMLATLRDSLNILLKQKSS